jgi:hypothetical protein
MISNESSFDKFFEFSLVQVLRELVQITAGGQHCPFVILSSLTTKALLITFSDISKGTGQVRGEL